MLIPQELQLSHRRFQYLLCVKGDYIDFTDG